MTTKYRVVGTFEWTEEREYFCTTEVDTIVDASSEEDARKRVWDDVMFDADTEEETFTSRQKQPTARLTFIVLESDDPQLLAMEHERQRIEDERRNLDIMRKHSSPLFPAFA